VSYHSAISSYALATTIRLLWELRQAESTPHDPPHLFETDLDKLSSGLFEQEKTWDISRPEAGIQEPLIVVATRSEHRVSGDQQTPAVMI
jgi:hypothetical protein